eukprot:135508_1
MNGTTLFSIIQFWLINAVLCTANFTLIPQIEIEGLLSIYNSTNGAHWVDPWNLTLIDSQHVCDENNKSPLTGIKCLLINTTHSHIQTIELSERNISGTIPSQISNFKAIDTISLRNISIRGTIPHSLCNLKTLKSLKIQYTYLNGSIPNCISNLSKLQSFDSKVNLNITGTIPKGFCQLPILKTLRIQYSTLTGTLHDCLLNKIGLQKFELNGNQLTGNIKSIPPNITNFQIAQNLFHGTLPSFPKTAQLTQFIIYENQFEGDINDVFPYLNVLKDVQGFALFNNDISGDITEILRYLFLNATSLGYIGIQNNPKITGTIPEFQHKINVIFHGHQSSNTWDGYFMIHNCDIYGSIPKNVQFQNLSYLTMYDNRLSCEIPSNFIPNVGIDRLFEVILPNNLFQTYDILPKWVNSVFRGAKSLYLNQFNILQFYVIGIFSFLLFGILSVEIIYDKIFKKYFLRNDNNASDKQPERGRKFFGKIDEIINVFCDMKILILSMILIIIYALNSSYYS